MDYLTKVEFLTYGHRDFFKHEDDPLFFSVMLAVAQDEKKLKLFAEFTFSMLEAVLDSNGKLQLSKFLVELYKASETNFESLEKNVFNDEDYLYNNDLKLEGWFMRRWIAARQTSLKHADDMIILYRYWMTRLAIKVDNPYGRDWAKSLLPQISKTNLVYKNEYVKELSKILK